MKMKCSHYPVTCHQTVTISLSLLRPNRYTSQDNRIVTGDTLQVNLWSYS